MQKEDEEYRARAAKCRELAQRVDPHSRAEFFQIAAAWERLAEEAARELASTGSAPEVAAR